MVDDHVLGLAGGDSWRARAYFVAFLSLSFLSTLLLVQVLIYVALGFPLELWDNLSQDKRDILEV
jgi:hypothetical protein